MNDDELYAERLREVLHGEGSAMSVSDDGLGKILQGAGDGEPPRRRPSWVAPLAVAAAAVLLLGGVALGISLTRGSGSPTATPGTSGSTSAVVSPSEQVSQATGSTGTSALPSGGHSSASTASSPTESAALAVYYVADVPGVGTRLYREFHTLPTEASPTGRITAALDELFGGNAVDPDYTTLWPSGTQALSVRVDGDLATVNVSDFPHIGEQGQAMAIQQVVWTVTAADPSVKRVQIQVNGQPPQGAASLGKPTARGNSLDTLANVWILAPAEGSTVASPVKVTVYGTGFEGNVIVRVLKDDGTQVAQKAVTTQMGAFASASTTFTLPAGGYQVQALNDNGKNATLLLWDTKNFTVG
ncbi:MAG TPA: GerMN domain-containing protein [Actinomycetes bacterium]|nr:GerMN domain-containing protein [Actinomycetes bacterium]